MEYSAPFSLYKYLAASYKKQTEIHHHHLKTTRCFTWKICHLIQKTHMWYVTRFMPPPSSSLKRPWLSFGGRPPSILEGCVGQPAAGMRARGPDGGCPAGAILAGFVSLSGGRVFLGTQEAIGLSSPEQRGCGEHGLPASPCVALG